MRLDIMLAALFAATSLSAPAYADTGDADGNRGHGWQGRAAGAPPASRGSASGRPDWGHGAGWRGGTRPDGIANVARPVASRPAEHGADNRRSDNGRSDNRRSDNSPGDRGRFFGGNWRASPSPAPPPNPVPPVAVGGSRDGRGNWRDGQPSDEWRNRWGNSARGDAARPGYDRRYDHARNDSWRNNDQRRGTGLRWNRDWRADDRYDWQRYRQYNRNAYRLPRYYEPFGYNHGYQRFSIGLYLGSSLYGRDYWIDDAADYRLPDVYPPYRWVRYYNDVLLVDTDSGEVVDVIYDFFW